MLQADWETVAVGVVELRPRWLRGQAKAGVQERSINIKAQRRVFMANGLRRKLRSIQTLAGGSQCRPRCLAAWALGRLEKLRGEGELGSCSLCREAWLQKFWSRSEEHESPASGRQKFRRCAHKKFADPFAFIAQ